MAGNIILSASLALCHVSCMNKVSSAIYSDLKTLCSCSVVA